MEGSTVLRSGALFVDSMLQEDLSLNGDYDLRGNRADRLLLRSHQQPLADPFSSPLLLPSGRIAALDGAPSLPLEKGEVSYRFLLQAVS
jgi:hypothetical protein